jgi:hypothetical protein
VEISVPRQFNKITKYLPWPGIERIPFIQILGLSYSKINISTG